MPRVKGGVWVKPGASEGARWDLGGASQTEDTGHAKVLRPAWAWPGKESPSAARRGSVKGERPREEALRGGGALWASLEDTGRTHWGVGVLGGRGAGVTGSGENLPGCFRRLCWKGLRGQERAARARRPAAIQAGRRRATQGDRGWGGAAGRLAVSRPGEKARANFHAGLAECSPCT